MSNFVNQQRQKYKLDTVDTADKEDSVNQLTKPLEAISYTNQSFHYTLSNWIMIIEKARPNDYSLLKAFMKKQ